LDCLTRKKSLERSPKVGPQGQAARAPSRGGPEPLAPDKGPDPLGSKGPDPLVKDPLGSKGPEPLAPDKGPDPPGSKGPDPLVKDPLASKDPDPLSPDKGPLGSKGPDHLVKSPLGSKDLDPLAPVKGPQGSKEPLDPVHSQAGQLKLGVSLVHKALVNHLEVGCVRCARLPSSTWAPRSRPTSATVPCVRTRCAAYVDSAPQTRR
jgi:hypothetical protein